MSKVRARAKSLVLAWYDKGRPSPRARQRFSHDVDRFFEALASRNYWRECISTLLDDDGAADFSIKRPGWQALPSCQGLVVSSVVPGWGSGWRSVFEDDESYDVFSWFGHYARQYIHRSNIAKVLMAAWERQGLLLHPFRSTSISLRYRGERLGSPIKSILGAARKEALEHWGAPRPATVFRSKWAMRNTLNPGIHQGIFHFLRAQRLVSASFELEAVTAFDCVLQALQQMDWSASPANPRRSRADLCLTLGLGPRLVSIAERAYFLRNQFSAHAGGWRWWDAGDYFDTDFTNDVSKMALRALRQAANLGLQDRSIDSSPNDWADWLEKQFPIIWSAVWFRDR